MFGVQFYPTPYHLVEQMMDKVDWSNDCCNLFGGRKKNWLPPAYGKKRYADMSTDEKAVVDQFEGQQQYQDTVQNEAFYLGTPGMMALMSAG